MARLILHAHRDGWETALNHPEAVVIDYPAATLRQGTKRFDLLNSPRKLRLLAFMLRGADLYHARRAVAEAVFGNPDTPPNMLSNLVKNCGPALAWLGMTIESAYACGLRLHSDPRETLPCRAQIAPSQQPPTLVKLPGNAAIASRRRPSRSWAKSAGSTKARTSRRRPSEASHNP